MSQKTEVRLLPEEAFDESRFQSCLYEKLKLRPDEFFVRPVRRSIDARGKTTWVNVQVDVVPADEMRPASRVRSYQDVRQSDRVIVVGAGPAGLFAALRLIEHGIKPVIFERGKDVKARRRDIAAINKAHVVNPESNYCFGEGGAGTYSDGKLYTRSNKRGDVARILETFIAHGAPDSILFDAHPHIGTNKLPGIVSALRETILQAGGEIHFETRVTDLMVSSTEIKGVQTADGSRHEALAVILATGHSARDIFQLLHDRGIFVEVKPFALGIRVEHPQNLIDRIQYHCSGERNHFLPASSYALVHQASVDGKVRGVFSFCMCPGGFIVPAATAPGEVVVNGMSPSRRDSKFANSGVVVAVDETDFQAFRQFGPLAGMHFQKEIEQLACRAGGGSQTAPAQRLGDLMAGQVSSSLLPTSYQPGLHAVDMRSVLPDFIFQSLKQGFRNFGTRMKGYTSNEAQVVGVESRTSSPVRIPRDKATLEHIQIRRLFPCAEGAGYAGGIVSAAMDGEQCADAAVRLYAKRS